MKLKWQTPIICIVKLYGDVLSSSMTTSTPNQSVAENDFPDIFGGVR